MNPLSAKRRGELRAEAHKLRPTVIIGDKGLTDPVVAEIDRSLKAHELIKVRAASGEREVRDAWLESICARLQAHPVQSIGKVFVIYRENPQEEKKAKLGPGPSSGVPDARGDETKRRRESTATMKARVVSEQARERQRLKDLKKRLDREAKVAGQRRRKLAPVPVPAEAGERGYQLKRTSRPRSRTPSPPPESGLRRRRRSTSR